MQLRKRWMWIVSAIAWPCVLAAQDPRGSIAGRITDGTGAVIPGVEVRATHMDTGVSASAVSNEAGNYSIPFLAPGLYRVTAELSGFKKFVQEGVEVRVGDALDLTIRMELGAVTEVVEVTGQTPLLETATSSLGLVVDQRRLQDLPQRGGSPMELALLAPGILNATSLRLLKSSAPGGISQMSAEGTGSGQTEFQIDGITNTAADTGDGTSRMAYSPPMSSVREFKMMTSPYDATIGHSLGAVMNVSTASGTNELHGSAYHFVRNSALDAPDFFNNKMGTKPSVYQDNRYGVSAGGPVVVPKLYNGRNRTFWFYAWEENRFGVPKTWTNTVPSAAHREGNFSDLLAIPQGSRYQIYNPFSTRPAPGGRFERDPFPNNVIPRSMLDPVGVNLANLYPLPNQPGTVDGRNNHFVSDKEESSYYTHLGRADHAFSENHRLFVRFNYYLFSNDKNDRFLNRANSLLINQIRRGVALDDVVVLSPTLVANLRYGLTNAEFLEKRATRGFDLSKLGFAPALVNLIDKRFATLPRLQPGAYTVLGQWQDGDGGNTSITHSFLAGFTKLHADHNMKFGADVRIYRSFGNRFPGSTAPDFSFTTTYTRGPLDNSPASPIGQDLASMLLGIPDGQMELSASYALQDKFLGLYFQDDYKLSARLTLNLGVRYELEAPVTERFNRLVAGFAFSESNPIEAQARANYARNPIPELSPSDFRVLGGLTWVDRNHRSPYGGEKNNIMPRFGLAYQLTPKTVIRSGYGMFFDSIGVNRTEAIQTGFSQATPIQASLDNGITYVARVANPLPNGLLLPRGPAGGLKTNLGQGLSFYRSVRLHGYAQRWSLGIQQVLPGDFLAEVSYVGNRGTRLEVTRNLNTTPARYLSTSPFRDQATINFLTQQFPNPFRGLDPIYGANISRANLLRPYPHFGNINVDEPVGYSWYHSLQARLERRFAQGFTFQLGYTFSKLMEATEFLNPTDALPYESIGAIDRPHRLTMSGIYEIPVGRGRRFASGMPKAANFLVGGWQLSGSVARQAGAALGFGNAIFTGNIKDIPLPKSRRDVDRWFNIDAGFNRNSSEQLASNIRAFPLRFSGVRGDGQASWDFAILKNFPVRERIRIQFRGEVYNAWNHPNFANPNTNPVNTAFGRVTSTNGYSRNWHLALKLTF